MAFNDGGKQIINGVLPPFKDLDSLPFHDFSVENSFIIDRDILPLTKDLIRSFFPTYPWGRTRPVFFILTSRGCPHQCSYCNNCKYISLFGRNSLRHRSVSHFMAELESSLEYLDFFDKVFFSDDDFFARPMSDLEAFVARYKETVGLPFNVCASANTFRKAKLEVLLDGGLQTVTVGLQSASQRVLDDVYNRKVKVAKVDQVVKEFAPYLERNPHLDLHLDAIYDNPYETEEEVTKTYRFLVNVPKRVWVNLYPLTLVVGTPLYDRAVEDGLLDPSDEKTVMHFGRKIRYHANYPTFLLLVFRELQLFGVKRFVPRFVLRCLASRPCVRLASVLPGSFFRFLIDMLPVAGYRLRTRLRKCWAYGPRKVKEAMKTVLLRRREPVTPQSSPRGTGEGRRAPATKG
jgi:radical SAM superfamily enzyme YgiQ (UPF0313 family)